MTIQEDRIRVILNELLKERLLPAGTIGPVEYVYAGYKDSDMKDMTGMSGFGQSSVLLSKKNIAD